MCATVCKEQREVTKQNTLKPETFNPAVVVLQAVATVTIPELRGFHSPQHHASQIYICPLSGAPPHHPRHMPSPIKLKSKRKDYAKVGELEGPAQIGSAW